MDRDTWARSISSVDQVAGRDRVPLLDPSEPMDRKVEEGELVDLGSGKAAVAMGPQAKLADSRFPLVLKVACGALLLHGIGRASGGGPHQRLSARRQSGGGALEQILSGSLGVEHEDAERGELGC